MNKDSMTNRLILGLLLTLAVFAFRFHSRQRC